MMYHRTSWEADITSASYSKKPHNTGGTSAAALSWSLAEYGSLVCGVWLAYLIFVLRSGQMVSFRWNFSSAKLVIWVEYDMINSTLCTTIPPVETTEWHVVFDCLRLLYVGNWYLICGIGRASVSYATKLARISRKYHFGGIFPLIRQCRPSVLPAFYLVKSRSFT